MDPERNDCAIEFVFLLSRFGGELSHVTLGCQKVWKKRAGAHQDHRLDTGGKLVV